MNETRKPTHPWADGWKWFEDEWDCSGQPIGEALLDAQAAAHRETGKVLRLVRLPGAAAAYLQAGMGRNVLFRGRGDTLGQHDWPEDAHVAVVSPLCPIVIAVDRTVERGRAILVGDGAQQRMVLCL